MLYILELNGYNGLKKEMLPVTVYNKIYILFTGNRFLKTLLWQGSCFRLSGSIKYLKKEGQDGIWKQALGQAT